MGSLADLMDYSLVHPVNKRLIEAKVFLRMQQTQQAQKYRLIRSLHNRSNRIFISTGKTKKPILF